MSTTCLQRQAVHRCQSEGKPVGEWQHLVRTSITSPEELADCLGLDRKQLEQVSERFPLRVNAYYMNLIREEGDPIWRQVIPDVRELVDEGMTDSLAEEDDSPVPGITHRYPDRVLFYVSHMCAAYCRFCTRKRKVSDPCSVDAEQVRRGIEYIRQHPEIRDVLLSGGDPFMLSDDRIDHILRSVSQIPHVEMIRIGSRMPVTLPQRITPKLCSILKRYHPLYVNTHFNHPREVTPHSSRACQMLADAGIPLGNQSVLLRGVNDDPDTMTELVQKLLAIRVRPYYLYLMDLVQGAQHFRTSVQKGLDIIQALRGHTTGLAVPTLVIDAPGGGGKIPIAPETILSLNDDEIVLRNYDGKVYHYPSQPVD
jgi:lysine 2,3-aminomutase